MSLKRSDVVCPYCLEKITERDLYYVCPVCGTKGEPTAVERLRRRLPLCKNGECTNKYASNRKCRFCGSILPSDIMDYEKYLRFSIIGIAGSGKSNFLTAMMHELRHNSVIPLVPMPMDDQTTTIFQENDRCLYYNRKPLEATRAGLPPQPQQWRLNDKSKISGNNIKTFSLTIFDGAGEDDEHPDPVICRYISGSKSLVILIDPLVLPGISDRIENNIVNWSTVSEHEANASTDMVNGIADYIRNSCGIPAGKLIDKDVAVVFSKIDAVKSTFGNATVMKSSPHVDKGGFVENDSEAVDLEIRSWLEENGETPFLNAVETNFVSKKTRFFGVSSFGQPPTGEDQLGKVVPHRILDPLLWMLSKEKIVPII